MGKLTVKIEINTGVSPAFGKSDKERAYAIKGFIEDAMRRAYNEGHFNANQFDMIIRDENNNKVGTAQIRNKNIV